MQALVVVCSGPSALSGSGTRDRCVLLFVTRRTEDGAYRRVIAHRRPQWTPAARGSNIEWRAQPMGATRQNSTHIASHAGGGGRSSFLLPPWRRSRLGAARGHTRRLEATRGVGWLHAHHATCAQPAPAPPEPLGQVLGDGTCATNRSFIE